MMKRLADVRWRFSIRTVFLILTVFAVLSLLAANYMRRMPPTTVSTLPDAKSIFNEERAIVLVYVDWSMTPRLSLDKLNALKATSLEWCPNDPVAFYVIRPEDDNQLNAWYESLFDKYPQFQLHGHGWGPFWWVNDGKIVDCVHKPWNISDDDLRARSVLNLCQ